jgi:hypothetical protein
VFRAAENLLITNPTPGAPNLGLNLFFDGNIGTPKISAFVPLNSSAFTPNNGAGTFGNTFGGSIVPGSGATSFIDGNFKVTLTAFNAGFPAGSPSNLVQPFDSSPDPNAAQVNYFGGLTIDVEPLAPPAVPEPTSLVLFGLGLGGLASFRWLRR